VEAIEHIPFDRRASAELFTLKSFSIAKVVHESGAKMIVAVGHLQAIQVTKNGEPMREFEAAVHRAQADQVLKTALEWQTPGAPEPVLFMGDLNVGPNSASALYDRLITEQGWKALDQGILNTWDANNPLVQASKVANKESAEIDHCLYRDTADVSILEASEKMVFQEAISSLMLGDEKVPLSDHYGLSCSFSVSARR
jgi:endonuclease/exonuclease/phosphatase family metal-dependent hydrolase